MDAQLVFSVLGSGCFGIFVGFAFRYFLEKFETYDVKTLAGALAVPVTTTLIVFVKDLGPNSRPSYTMGLVLGLVLYQAFYSKFPSLPMRHTRTGLLAIIETSDVVTIFDGDGKKANWVRTQKMKFNVSAREALITRLAGEGQIVPTKITSSGRIVTFEARKKYVYVLFNSGVKRGDIVDIILESEVNDSFPTNIEWFERDVLQPIDKLTIEVRFPDSRRCLAAELIKIFGADEQKIEQLVPGGVVRAVVTGNMQIGESYRVSWQW